MSKLADLAYDIEQLFIEGLTAQEISTALGCPIGVVKGWIEGNGCDDAFEFYSPYESINS